jgi:glycerol-3-phosphate acyltransferase PlsY
LLGSIPTGYLAGRAKGIDIRKVGSGNIGATNAFRILGKGPGALVLLVDALKGWAAVQLAAPFILQSVAGDTGPGVREAAALLAGFTAVLGHNYTCWLGFKGGKGIATSAGVLAGLVPAALVSVLCVWIIIFILWRYVSLASISAAAVLPFAVGLTGYSWTLISVTAVMGALAIYKHKANIERLRKGTENRIGGRKSEASGQGPSSTT